MLYHKLGSSNLNVSRLCLGTMTFGEQNTPEHAFEQLDYAIAHGINFIDTAEMYPVPPRPDTQGRTEEIIGDWLSARGNRDQVILASKVTGRSNIMTWMRGGATLARAQIEQAVDDSLKRLKTDYIDLYQVHWPDRQTNYFGKLGYVHKEDDSVPILETLQTLADIIKSGKVRYIGISNETPWGTMQYLLEAERHNLPRIVSIQNPYNLLNRTYEVGLAEFAHREAVPLLAYSPLAFGVLTGKYLDGARPEHARLTLFKRFIRYSGNEADGAVKAYLDLASQHGLDGAQMALAYVNSRPFLGANIIGATTMEQLKTNIASKELVLADEVVEAIELIHQRHPNPCP